MKPTLTIQELNVGIYILMRTIENPDADRRTRHDWRKDKRWLQGTVFEVRDISLNGDKPLKVLGKQRSNSSATKGYTELVSALEPEVNCLEHVLIKHGWSTSLHNHLVSLLLEQKAVTLEQIDAALAAHIAKHKVRG